MESPGTQIFRVYKTILEMMKDRMYMIDNAEENLTKEEFFQIHGISDDDIEIGREKLTLMKRAKKDPLNLILVFFPNEAKMTTKGMAKYFLYMDKAKVTRAIFVLQQDLSPHAKTALAQGTRKIECFKESELLVNITKHVLVPKHFLLTQEEKEELLMRYKLKETQLPCLQRADPVAKYFGLDRGDVVKIVRNSETAGKYVTYRLVI